MIGPFRRHPRNFAAVELGALYRSGAITPRTLALLCKRYQLRTIVDLGATTLLPDKESAIRAAAERLGVQRYALRLKGTGVGDPNEYVRALRILANPEHRPVLVHCAAGAQRTGACIIFYRHILENTPLDRAFAEAERFGHCPRKDAALREYIEQWLAPIGESLRTGEVIAYDGPTARQDNRTPIDQLP